LRDLIRAVWEADYGEGTIRDFLAAEEAKATDLRAWFADEFNQILRQRPRKDAAPHREPHRHGDEAARRNSRRLTPPHPSPP
jgi:hypothetical protein